MFGFSLMQKSDCRDDIAERQLMPVKQEFTPAI
jgi:hypothetical protein